MADPEEPAPVRISFCEYAPCFAIPFYKKDLAPVMKTACPCRGCEDIAK